MNIRSAAVGAGATVAVAVGVFAAVATANAQQAGPEPTPVTAAAAASTASDDARYLRAMRWLVPGSAFEDSSDADLVGYAKNFCSNGADASGLSDAAAVQEMFDISPGELRSIFRVMVANYCPEHRGNV